MREVKFAGSTGRSPDLPGRGGSDGDRLVAEPGGGL